MPVSPDLPQPLRVALESMEAHVQAAKRSLAYAAPEVQDQFWGQLQLDLADAMQLLFQESQDGKA